MPKLSLLLGACSLLIACGSSIDDVDPLAQGGSAGSAAGNASAGTGGGGSTGAGGIGVGGTAMSGGSPFGGSAESGGMLGTGGALGGSGSGGAFSGGATQGGAANGGAKQSGGATQGGAAQAGGTQGGAAQGGATQGGTAGSAHTNPLTQAQIDAFVTAHNQARSGNLNPPPSPPLPPVTWDATLADVAFNYLSKCQGTTLSDHNANRTKDYAALGGKDYVGENIYATSGKSVDPAAALKSWMNEADAFDYDSPNLSAAGHYTQVVWRTSVRIGCAIVNCPNMKYPNNVLCDYAPGGNVNGQKPY